MGAKQLTGCLHGDDRNTHHLYSSYPSYLEFQLSKAQHVNHCSGYLDDDDGRKHSMLFEASLDVNWIFFFNLFKQP
jgi:hypothetical protein